MKMPKAHQFSSLIQISCTAYVQWASDDLSALPNVTVSVHWEILLHWHRHVFQVEGQLYQYDQILMLHEWLEKMQKQKTLLAETHSICKTKHSTPSISIEPWLKMHWTYRCMSRVFFTCCFCFPVNLTTWSLFTQTFVFTSINIMSNPNNALGCHKQDGC